MDRPSRHRCPMHRMVTPRADRIGSRDRDTQRVTIHAHDRRMNILLDCAWCGDEVVFEVDETDDELVCSACNTRTAFAPDPVTTFELLYEPAAA